MRPIHTTLLPLAAAAAALGSAAGAGDVSLFLGPPGGIGAVAVFDEAGAGVPSSPAGLQGIRLLPVELAGRTRLERFLPDRARLELDVPGAGRLVLPLGQGSLYRYERPGPAGLTFGWMLIGADGAARSIFERDGTGPAGDEDPFVPRIAVSPHGDAALIGTTVAAGGDALEVDLRTGAVEDRTPHLPPLALSGSGLALRSAWGVAVHSSGVLRFDRSPGALADAVPLTGAPVWFGGEVVLSGDGLRAATIAGTSPGLAQVYAFERTGVSRPVSGAPAALSPAGFLPGQLDGPYLSLSTDGALALWRTEDLVSREAWMARTQPVAGDQAHQLTADASYLDTLDEVGLVGPHTFAAGSSSMVVAVGERQDPILGGLDGMDFYRVTLQAGGAPQYENLTLSSGDPLVPFTLKSTINPEDGVWRAPNTDRLLLSDSDGDRLLLVDTATGASTVLMSLVKSTDAVACGSGRFLLSIRREDPIKKRQLVCVDPVAGTAKILGTLAEETVFSRLTVRADGWAGVVVEEGLFQWLVRVHTTTGAMEVLTYLPATFGPTLAWTPDGRLLLSGMLGATPPLFLGWGLGTTSALYPTTASAGFALPGA